MAVFEQALDRRRSSLRDRRIETVAPADHTIYSLTMRSDQSPEPGRTFTEKARRAQIINCAIEAICELGHAGASLAEIARRAGVSKGVVSYYFAGKEDLLGNVIVGVYARAGAAIQEAIKAESHPGRALRAYIEANLDFLEDNPRDIAAVMDIAANARRRDGTLTFAPDGDDPVLAHLEQILRGGQDDGTLVEFNPRSLAILIRGAIDTAAGRLVKDPDFDFAAYRDQLVAIAESITARKEA